MSGNGTNFGIFRNGSGRCLTTYERGHGDNRTCQPITDESSPASVTRIEYDVTQNVYAYGLNDITIYLAFTVLFLHVATVAVHMLIILLGNRRNSQAWSSLGGLFNLALQSPPADRLANTGVGTEASKTWRLRASVEELPGENQVGLSIRDGVAPDADGDKQTPRSLPRADWKYS